MEQNETNSLKHHGILGMKWGVRRYQNKDGSLTPAGKRKAAKMKDEYTKLTGKRLIRKPTPKSTANTDQNGKENANRKSIKDMSDTEVQKRIDRLQKEKQLMGLQSETASKGEKFVSTVTKQIIVPAAVDAGKKMLTDWFVKGGSELLGLNAKETKSAYEQLKEENNMWEWKAKIQKNKDWLDDREKRESKKKESSSTEEKTKAKFAGNIYDDKKTDTSSKKKESVVIDAEWEDIPNNSTALIPYKKKKRN